MSGDNMSLKFGDEKSKKKSIEIKHGAENIVPERSEKVLQSFDAPWVEINSDAHALTTQLSFFYQII